MGTLCQQPATSTRSNTGTLEVHSEAAGNEEEETTDQDRFSRVLAMFLSKEDALSLCKQGADGFILENDDNRNKLQSILDELEPAPLH
mmetsp:Transcript_119362/g.178317  ORF Transcript_119362/g.178317 Transcript_119362/m.178317 type:complete len:88 (+) Transcript_119362:221-484(+)